jgi:hypothetical protein
VRGEFKTPLDNVGADTELFSVLTQVIAFADAVKSTINIVTTWSNIAPVVGIVIVIAAAEELTKVFVLLRRDTVPTLDITEIILLRSMI